MLRAAALAQILWWSAPSGVRGEYDLQDPQAEHKARAIELDEAGDLAGAIRSFRQAAIFAPDGARSECAGGRRRF